MMSNSSNNILVNLVNFYHSFTRNLRVEQLIHIYFQKYISFLEKLEISEGIVFNHQLHDSKYLIARYKTTWCTGALFTGKL